MIPTKANIPSHIEDITKDMAVMMADMFEVATEILELPLLDVEDSDISDQVKNFQTQLYFCLLLMEILTERKSYIKAKKLFREKYKKNRGFKS
ncbi:hypothetical protein [Cyanobacterium aponinum]|uniref:hypothetical protein n=1 Tax=Cyanobacterium aponinum TaxID=379064 RepID=UPI000C12D7F5|nr:hypothetical protein [Cyanobacterium aponinum]PHV63204.1 hypothetical protein CSQ80_06625 [Cyanobacterium aponinum IPPAS B-1201]